MTRKRGANNEGAVSGGDPPLFAGVPHVLGANYRLADIARVLGRAVQSLRALAARGEFPRLFRLSRNDWRVEKESLEAWAVDCWKVEAHQSHRRDAVRAAIRQPASRRRST